MDSKKRTYRRQRRTPNLAARVAGVSSLREGDKQGTHSATAAAARALAAGDPLGALNWVALRDDAPALALRGIAMARLGDLIRAKTLLRRAQRAFGPHEAVACARCVVAEAEIALVSRDLGWPAKALSAARTTLAEHGDSVNAAYARHLEIRHLLLIGRLDQAEQAMAELDAAVFPPASRAAHELLMAGIALRRLQTKTARAALSRAERAARHAAIPALMAEIESVSLVLKTPAARLIARGREQLLLLEEVEPLLRSEIVLIDACRYNVRSGGSVTSLARRPVLFALARALGEAWPNDVPRSTLIAQAFGGKRADESHRARLRVEIGRLRKLLRKLADVSATMRGFALVPRKGYAAAVLARPVEEEHAAVLAFLADGESWSSSALAVALGASQRTVQRALDSLAASGKVQSFGRGRALRWMTPPVPGFTTILLLPAPLPID
jgi:DNA-binding winged helix-turn-helix (wHTH) protein